MPQLHPHTISMHVSLNKQTFLLLLNSNKQKKECNEITNNSPQQETTRSKGIVVEKKKKKKSKGIVFNFVLLTVPFDDIQLYTLILSPNNLLHKLAKCLSPLMTIIITYPNKKKTCHRLI